MAEAVTALEETGKRVFTFAPTSEASRGVLRSEGFKNADTVQRLIVDKNFQAELKNQIIWIDEAGLLSAKSMNQVFQVAAKQNAASFSPGTITSMEAWNGGMLCAFWNNRRDCVPLSCRK
jgi:hypothetical protein